MNLLAIVSSLQLGSVVPWMVLYVGPDVFLPFLSAVAGALGVLLMFWQRVTGLVARLWRTTFRRHG